MGPTLAPSSPGESFSSCHIRKLVPYKEAGSPGESFSSWCHIRKVPYKEAGSPGESFSSWYEGRKRRKVAGKGGASEVGGWHGREDGIW